MMDNNDRTPNPTPSTDGADTGPAVRKMSPQVRAHARRTLLAETSLTTVSGAESLAVADGVSFGRDGVDDAPAPLKKRWMVIASGLAVAAAGAAIIAGYGVLSGDDLGTGPADTDQSQDGNADSAEGGSDLNLVRARGDCMDSEISPGIDDSAVLYEHQTADYAIVAVTYGGTTQMCAVSEAFGGSSSSEATSRANPVTEMIRLTQVDGDNFTETLGGKVTDDVTKVEILSAGEPVATAHLEDTWFSAFAITSAGEELSYRVTLSDDSTKDVVVDGLFYENPIARQESFDEINQEFAESCFDDTGITLSATPTSGDAQAEGSEGEYILAKTLNERSYLVHFAENGTDVSMCTQTDGQITWGATQPMTLPAGAPIAPFNISPAPTDKGPYPVIGLAAPNVTSVDVVRADGKRRETVLEDGYYTLMLPATDVEDLTYVVYTDDGESKTIGSD